MIPISLRLQRFGSFVEEQLFEFPEKPGLYFMQGINRAEPRLQANGTGKSTVWKALTWVLFGKDPRGLKAGDAVNWENPKDAAVDFEFEHEGKVWSVIRQHAPNRWLLRLPDDVMGEEGFGCTIDLAKDPANPMLAMLRLEFESFLNSVLMAQDEPMFLDLKADPKAALFSEVMGLDKWIGYSAKASEKAKAEDDKIRKFEREVASLRGSINSLRGEDLTDSIDEWDGKRKLRLREIEGEYAKLIDRSEDQKKIIDAAEHKLDVLASAMADRRKKMDHVDDLFNQVKQAITGVSAEGRALDVEVKRLAKLIKLLRESSHCPTCGTAGADLKEAIARAASDHRKASQQAEQHQKDFDRLQGELAASERKAQGLKESLQEAIRDHQAGDRALSDEKRSYELLGRRLDQLEEQADKVTAEVNPYEQLQRESRDRLRTQAASLSETQARLDAAAERYSMLGFWVRGFKDLRLQLIAESLQQLDIEVNSCVTSLGLIGWEIKFEVDRETKGGSISRGFSVYIRSPHNDKLVPWASWSGGEAQRLRLAAQMGLANLIRSATGATMALEVWDEPTKGMSHQGIADLMDALSIRAKQEKRQIWVVDHRSLGYGGFDGGITVVKDDQGSRFTTGG